MNERPLPSALLAVPLRPAHFERVRRLARDLFGLHLRPGQEALVKARLTRRLLALGLTGFDAYLRYVEQDPTRQELSAMVDALTTNETSFFREPVHFDVLRRQVAPALERTEAPRLWSAGCSSGEEPYSIALALTDALSARALAATRILATDVSRRMLARARDAVYPADALGQVPDVLLRRYFAPVTRPPGHYRLDGPPRRLVSLARLNLHADWPMRGPFHGVFCRNVMIYFDPPTRQRLVERLGAILAPGGYLFVGLSENLSTIQHGLTCDQPGVYRRP